MHVRLWAAEQAGRRRRRRQPRRCAVDHLYARALGAKIGRGVDLHTPPAGHRDADDRRRRLDRTRGRPGRLLARRRPAARRPRSASAPTRRSGSRSTLLPGAEVGRRRRDRAPARPSCGTVPAGERWSGSPAQPARQRPAPVARPSAPPAARRWVLAYGVAVGADVAASRSLAAAGRRPRARASGRATPTDLGDAALAALLAVPAADRWSGS